MSKLFITSVLIAVEANNETDARHKLGRILDQKPIRQWRYHQDYYRSEWQTPREVDHMVPSDYETYPDSADAFEFRP